MTGPSQSPSSTAAPTAAQSGLQRALAAEQQAAFGYALIGPHVAPARTDAVRAAQALHEDLRDRVAGLLAAASVEPAAPLGDYPALYPQLSRPLALAATLEDACTAGWRFAFATATAVAGRRQAQQQLTAAAVRATRWRLLAGDTTPITAFPGI